MVSLASTEVLDKGLLPGHARMLLVHFLKEAELNIYFFKRTSVTYTKLPKGTCQGPRGIGMVALCSPALEVENAPRGAKPMSPLHLCSELSQSP